MDPFDGGYTSWSEWSLCSVTCGVGEMTRSRECSNPTPEYGGADCDGVANETSACSSECPIDGQFTEWTTWTQCSATCGNGDQIRSRSCSNPVPQFGGVDCIGATEETVTCNLASCSPERIDGGFNDWSVWTACSVTCGSGQQSRNRTCSNPEPQNGGNDCEGDLEETQPCSSDSCPPEIIDGGFSDWSDWTECSVTCGGGEQTRIRTCSNPVPQNGGSDCVGDAEESQPCSTESCSPDRRRSAPNETINGAFSDWSVWTECSVTCGGGEQTRSRTCSNPEPQNGGNDCLGELVETLSCNTDSCPPEIIDGGFSNWSDWTECSVTCGGGEKTRNRTCSNPEPQNGGNDCVGDSGETQPCSTSSCPPDGGLSNWSDWTECSVTCGGGKQTRNRTCSNPEPQNGGNDCVGDSGETQPCSTSSCPPEIIDGGFSNWSDWTECSVTCGGGEKTRNRTCSNPEPQNGGNDCVGDSGETQPCSTSSCPPEIIDGGFSYWSNWTECSVTCGGGKQTRNRTCSNPEPQNGGNDCVGDSGETQPCSTSSCPSEIIDGGLSEWSNWTECSSSCGGGEHTRSRTCSNPEPQNGGNDCVGDLEETQPCNTDSCPPVDGGFSVWTTWSDCTVTCGDGQQTRSRTCTNPEPQNGGNNCVGDTGEYQICNLTSCLPEIIDGGFSDWSDWTECSVTCGGGEQTRSRTCSRTVPENGGIDCVGDLEETQPCNTDTCPPVDGGFTEWTAWTECSVSCGDGQQTRTRECSNPEPQFGGNDCEGNIEGIMACNLAHCPVNGEFTDWSIWSECSVTCGNGTHIRSRDCSNPEPQYGGEDCVGETEESETCELDPCPVDGYWLSWEDWTLCSASCGSSGTRERTRTCVDPLNGGNPCNGAGEQVEFCNTQECPFDGVWSDWASWGDCNATCEGGVKERTRSCIGPLYGGTECTGISRETDVCNEIPCPIDGHWANWDEWSTCTFTCNTGTRERTRDCIDPQYGGENCTGAEMQTEFCNTNLCPVDGEWRNWSEWSTCTMSCGGGSRNRSRTCIEPLYGGFDCMGNETDTENCNEEPCPVNGFWLEWSKWDSCSVSCADGTRNRSRSCVEPSYGGANCTGESSQSEYCNNGNCPIDGFWSDWSEWTKCSQTCGGGYRNKSRECNEPLYGGLMCQGEMSETDTCNVDACPIDGEWLDWSQWSTCSKTCGGGTRVKTRNCTQPKYGGKFCEGESSETDMCNVEPCAVDGYWKEWSNWTECSVSCAGGSRNRTRECVQPKFGGKECTGIDADEEECNKHDCPVDGIWTTWLQWSECSATCNGGARNRSRTCIGTQNGGKYCAGHDVDIQICALELCPSIDGGWSDWTSWTACSMSCGFSERTRNRTCTNPSPQWGGKYCEGIHIQSDSCMENDCPVDGVWSSWATWSPCLNMTVNDVSSPKCGRGFRYRNRTCDNPAPQFAGSDCNGNLTEIKNCNIPCHVITCSKENPEKCQIVFQNIPGNKGNKAATSTSVVISILSFIVKLCI